MAAAITVAVASDNAIDSYDSKSIFNYLRNGVKIDVKVVPAANDTGVEVDNFPAFPVKDIGHCVVEMSLSCAQRRIARFLETVGGLKEITLFGQNVKLVKLKELPEDRISERRMIVGPGEMIDRSIDDFFEKFALRITMPRWKGKKNQIDLKFEDTDVVEGSFVFVFVFIITFLLFVFSRLYQIYDNFLPSLGQIFLNARVSKQKF